MPRSLSCLPSFAADPRVSRRGPLRVPGWELVRHVADGTYARIYRARPTNGRPDAPAAYAVKILAEEWSDRPELVALLAREAHLGRVIRHPHLVSILDARVDRRPFYLVSPWLSGSTLEDRLLRGPAFDLPVVLWIIRQTAEALAALEHRGWTHGDVKASNIMVSDEGHVTLIDLGFARPLGEDGSAVDRPVMGSCHYLAPERITSRLAVDIRGDLYSLGVVLFRALAGRLPFEGTSLESLAEQHRSARPPALRRLAPMVPGEVADLTARLLAKAPWRRPRHARDVVDELVALEIAAFGARSLT